jgi:ergothioneine biosynthesis protein EgtB
MSATDTFSRHPVAADPSGLLDRYRSVRGHTVALCEGLSPEDCQAQSMPDASPVKWHLAHTTWFFETFVLGGFAAGYTPAFESYRVLFNSYYNAIGQKHPRPQRGLLTRPTLAEVMTYRAVVDDAMTALIDGIDRREGAPGLPALVTLGLHHEQQHQELILTDVKHLLSCNPLGPAYRGGGKSGPGAGEPGTSASAGGPALSGPPGYRRFDGGIVRIGYEGSGFAFDNEGPAHEALLQPFQLADRLVTCGEYLAFIEDGGYRRPEFWLSLGWDKVQAENWQMPAYWRRAASDRLSAAASGIEHFTLAGWQPLPPAAPAAHLSYFEADAYARWADARLPTEAEWEHAARQDLQWGGLWEWTSSAYGPYPGFKASADAVGEYNGKFMCNQYVLRGASFATASAHSRVSYRNFFPPEARWQFTGLRLARDDDRPAPSRADRPR